MTITELLGTSVEELEAMTDDELVKHVEPYLNITRPELAAAKLPTRTKQTKINKPKKYTRSNNAALMAGAKALLAGDVAKARQISKGQI